MNNKPSSSSNEHHRSSPKASKGLSHKVAGVILAISASMSAACGSEKSVDYPSAWSGEFCSPESAEQKRIWNNPYAKEFGHAGDFPPDKAPCVDPYLNKAQDELVLRALAQTSHYNDPNKFDSSLDEWYQDELALREREALQKAADRKEAERKLANSRGVPSVSAEDEYRQTHMGADPTDQWLERNGD